MDGRAAWQSGREVITAVDTSVLLDVFDADPKFGRASVEALRECVTSGSLIACEVVIAETASAFPDQESARAAFDRHSESRSCRWMSSQPTPPQTPGALIERVGVGANVSRRIS